MGMKMVVIKIPLYDYNEDDTVRPLTGSVVDEIMEDIKGKDDVCGWSIGSIELVEEDWEVR